MTSFVLEFSRDCRDVAEQVLNGNIRSDIFSNSVADGSLEFTDWKEGSQQEAATIVVVDRLESGETQIPTYGCGRRSSLR